MSPIKWCAGSQKKGRPTSISTKMVCSNMHTCDIFTVIFPGPYPSSIPYGPQLGPQGAAWVQKTSQCEFEREQRSRA